MMVRTVIVSAAAVISLAFGCDPTKAAEAPWCAVTNTGPDMHWDCRYQSAEQCAPAVTAGNRGFCNNNPYYVAQPVERRSQRRPRT
jgi:Protein of unknown function (DUF3551)